MAFPVILRVEGFPLDVIGFMQFAGLAYLLKFLWAPLLDRGGMEKNHYKRWTFWTGVISGLLLIALGTFDLKADFSLIVTLIMINSVIISTQDIAVNALYIKLLSFEDRGAGSSSKILSMNIGSILGSGLFLLIYNHFGWQVSLTGMGIISLAVLIPLSRLEERQHQHKGSTPRNWIAFFTFFKRKGMTRWIILTVLNAISISAIYFLIKPFLVDSGISPDTIALLVGFFGMSVAALTAMFTSNSRFQQYILTRRRAYLDSVIIAGIAVTLFIPASLYTENAILLYFTVALLNIAMTVGSIINATLVMDFSRNGLESVDYSLQMTAIHVGGIFIAVVSGVIVSTIGYQNFFIAMGVLGILMIPISALMFQGNWIPKNDTSGDNSPPLRNPTNLAS